MGLPEGWGSSKWWLEAGILPGDGKGEEGRGLPTEGLNDEQRVRGTRTVLASVEGSDDYMVKQWGWVLHLERWDQGDSRSFVTRSVQKDSKGLLSLDGRYSRRDRRPSSTVDKE